MPEEAHIPRTSAGLKCAPWTAQCGHVDRGGILGPLGVVPGGGGVPYRPCQCGGHHPTGPAGKPPPEISILVLILVLILKINMRPVDTTLMQPVWSAPHLRICRHGASGDSNLDLVHECDANMNFNLAPPEHPEGTALMPPVRRSPFRQTFHQPAISLDPVMVCKRVQGLDHPLGIAGTEVVEMLLFISRPVV